MRRVTLLLVSVLSLSAAVDARAQTPLTTAFTYQGELANAGTPATGTYDIRFLLYDAATGGTQIGSPLCSDDLAVTNGRFAASLDFGAAAFAGQQRFLEIEVRQDTGLACSDATGWTLLTPRQELTATPNASFAQSAASAATATTALSATNAASLNGQSPSFYQNAANLTGTLADARLSDNIARLDGNQTFTGLLNFTNAGNTFAGIGAGLTNLNGASINAGTLARSSLTADVQGGVGTVGLDSSAAGSVATGNNPRSAAVSGSFAYVVNQSANTLQVIDISNPTSPTVVGSVATGSNPYSVAVSGSFAYVVNQSSNTLQVIDISNPASPTVVGSVATGSNPRSVAVSGSFAYVVNQFSHVLQVFNISNPATPVLAGSVATGSQPFSVAVSGSFAYVVNYNSNTLQVFNISNSSTPTLAGSITTGSLPQSVAVSGSFAYVVNYGSQTLQVFNISNSSAPTLAGSITTGSLPQSVAVSGSFAYVVNFSGTLQVVNISNPTTPVLAGTITTNTGPTAVAVSNSYAYVVNYSASTLQIFSAVPSVSFGRPLAASALAGVNGSGLTGVNANRFNGQSASFYTNASNISTGTLAAAQIPGLDASKIISGTLSDARLSSNVALLSNRNATQFAGALGIGMTPTGGARLQVVGYDPGVVDQSQPISIGNAASNENWQSFTAGLTGQLTGVRLGIGPTSGTASPGTIQIYEGEGTGGQLLATQDVIYPAGVALRQFDFSTPGNVTAGSVYTVRFTVPNGALYVELSDTNPYAGGRYRNGNFPPPTFDAQFQTLVAVPRSSLNVTDAGVTAPAFFGSGAGLTNLNASNIASGTLGDAVLSANIPRLNINNSFTSTRNTFAGRLGVNTPAGALELDVNGRINVAQGVIQKDLSAGVVTGTTDLGLYSQIAGGWIRFVTNNAQFAWFTDSGAGTTARMILSPTGNLSVTGSLSKGGGSFKIDHPLDPENKFLFHSFVESPDMMNVYNGNIVTDAEGYATITLPDYFEALNRDFRYQLTVIDESNDMDVFLWAKVIKKISGNQFTIRSSRGNLEVSWQITGIRKDAWAEKNRIPNSVDKVGNEKGKYLHPEAFDKPTSQSIVSSPAADSHSASK